MSEISIEPSDQITDAEIDIVAIAIWQSPFLTHKNDEDVFEWESVSEAFKADLRKEARHFLEIARRARGA